MVVPSRQGRRGVARDEARSAPYAHSDAGPHPYPCPDPRTPARDAPSACPDRLHGAAGAARRAHAADALLAGVYDHGQAARG
ncbi:hypothetical protein CCP3SC15_2410006 [Gammaproteobacteria bacterium]